MNVSLISSFALVCGALGVVYALFMAAWINKQSAGSEKMQQISEAIREGATAFLNREYKTVAVVAIILAALLTYPANGPP
jgi:K(+)-stimulated pyrophosphate-energized sodium pump